MTGASEARVTPLKPTADDLLAVAKIADAIACRDFKRADKIAAAHRQSATAPLIEVIEAARDDAANIAQDAEQGVAYVEEVNVEQLLATIASYSRRLEARLTAALAAHQGEG